MSSSYSNISITSLSLQKLFKDQKIRTKVDQREEKLGYKIREAQTNKIPYQIVIGNNEVSLDQVTYRKYGETEQLTVSKIGRAHV